MQHPLIEPGDATQHGPRQLSGQAIAGQLAADQLLCLKDVAPTKFGCIDPKGWTSGFMSTRILLEGSPCILLVLKKRHKHKMRWLIKIP